MGLGSRLSLGSEGLVHIPDNQFEFVVLLNTKKQTNLVADEHTTESHLVEQ